MPAGKFIFGLVFLSVLPLLFLVARYFAKRSKLLKWSIDDTLLVLALLFQYVVVAMLVVSMAASLVRRHITAATTDDIVLSLKILWLFRIPLTISLNLTRCAILIFFIRTLYIKNYSKLRLVAHFCILVAIGMALTSLMVTSLHCRPLKYNYAIPAENPKYCFQMKPFSRSISIMGVILDGLIWYLPHRVVWNLKLRTSHKLAVSGMFGFGLFNIVIGALRIDSIADIVFHGDVTYNLATTLMWAIARISTGIIVTCCPLLRPLFDMFLPQRLIRLSTRMSKSTSKTTQASKNTVGSKITVGSHTSQSIQVPQVDRSRSGSITVTTIIAVRKSVHLPRLSAHFHDGSLESWGTRFDVEQGPASRLKDRAYSRGSSPPGFGCLCRDRTNTV